MSFVWGSRNSCVPIIEVLVFTASPSSFISSPTRRSFSCVDMPSFQSMVISVSLCLTCGMRSFSITFSIYMVAGMMHRNSSRHLPAWRSTRSITHS